MEKRIIVFADSLIISLVETIFDKFMNAITRFLSPVENPNKKFNSCTI